MSSKARSVIHLVCVVLIGSLVVAAVTIKRGNAQTLQRVAAELAFVIMRHHVVPWVRTYAAQSIPDLVHIADRFRRTLKGDNRSWYDFWSDKDRTTNAQRELIFATASERLIPPGYAAIVATIEKQ